MRGISDRGAGIPHVIVVKTFEREKPSGNKTATQGKSTMHAFHLSITNCHARGGLWAFALAWLVRGLEPRRWYCVMVQGLWTVDKL